MKKGDIVKLKYHQDDEKCEDPKPHVDLYPGMIGKIIEISHEDCGVKFFKEENLKGWPFTSLDSVVQVLPYSNLELVSFVDSYIEALNKLDLIIQDKEKNYGI